MDQVSQATDPFEADRVWSQATDPFEAPPIGQSNDQGHGRGFLLFWGAYLVVAVALYAVTGYLVYRLVGALT
jgi:hypothetical protein